MKVPFEKVLTKLGDRLGKAYLPILLAVFSSFIYDYVWQRPSEKSRN